MTASRYSAVLGTLLVMMLVAAAWTIAYSMGGSHTVGPHLFYVPVVLAAVRFGRVGALVAALGAALAAGPMLPLNVEAGTTQPSLNWMLRGGAFAGIGLAVAFLVHHSRGAIGDEFAKAAIRRDLRRALDSRHLHVAYQPIVELATNSTVGAEALIRWSDPERGPQSPAEFIPAVESAGAAHLISELVLADVTHHLGQWRSTGLVVRDEPFGVSVNISGTELRDHRLETLIRDLVVHDRIAPEWLHLEVTETALISDLDHAIAGLQRLRGIGVRLAIDDFGTGESSLRYLHRFPTDTLKIDRSFIQPLVDDHHGRHIVRCVIDLAHNMGLRTIAEGVETAEHATLLADMGCDLAQGYHFSKPLNPVDFEEHLERQATSTRTTHRRLDQPEQ